MTADRRAALGEKVALIEKLANDLAAQPGGRTARMCEIDRLISLIRAEVLEEAARVADALEDSLATEWREGRKCDSHLEGKSDGAGEVAAAIRALKEAPCTSS